jgi:hypothetical protein
VVLEIDLFPFGGGGFFLLGITYFITGNYVFFGVESGNVKFHNGQECLLSGAIVCFKLYVLSFTMKLFASAKSTKIRKQILDPQVRGQK